MRLNPRQKATVALLSFLLVLNCVGFAQKPGIHQIDTIVFDPIHGIYKSSNAEKLKQRASVIRSSQELSIIQRNSSTTVDLAATSSSTPSHCGDYNGTILVTATGGTPPYTYSFDGGPFQSSRFFVSRGPGSYPVIVKDATGATVTIMAGINNTTIPVRLSGISQTSPSGCDAADGSVTLLGYEGIPPYTYSIDGINFQSSNTFTNLPGGVYNFVVKDANGCLGTTWFPLTNTRCHSSNGYGGTYSEYACTNEGIIDFAPENGRPPFEYSLDGVTYQNDNRFTGLTPGTYTVHIIDGNGVNFKFGVNIYSLCLFIVNSTVTDATCGNSDGSFEVTLTNGTAPFQYSIDGVNFQSSNIFTGLAKGYYGIVVKDATGQASTGLAIVEDDCPIVNATSTAAGCANNDGTITATASEGVAPYEYSIDGINFQTNNTFTGLARGNYTVTARDAAGHTGTTTVNVGRSCLLVTATPTHVVCGNQNGKITVTTTNGTAPFEYSLNGGSFQTSNEFTGLGYGTYSITVRDATGETVNTSAIIDNSPAPSFSATTTPTSCNFNDGTITVSVSSGSPPYTYSLNGIDYQTSNVFTNVYYNTYTVYVKDVNGCVSAICCYFVNAYCLALNTTAVDATCGNSNGRITATASGGTEPYEYSIDGVNFQSSPDFTGLAAGTYTIHARDIGGLSRTAQVTVRNVCVSLSVTATDALCDRADGTITATAVDGTAPYTFSIDGINFQSSNIFQSIIEGNYIVTVKDANGYINTSPVTVGNIAGPQMLTVTGAATCINNDGIITITGSGGRSPFMYAIDNSNFQSSNNFSQLASGNHIARVKDANGCITTQPVIVVINNTLTIEAGTDITICEGTQGAINANSNGSTFAWSPAAGLNNSTLLRPGASPRVTTEYFVTAKLGICERIDSVMVLVDPAPIADAGPGDTICFGQSAQLQGSGGLSYSWSPATSLDNTNIADPVTNKPATTIAYHLVVTDAKGCRSLNDESVTIHVTPPAKVFAGKDTSIFMNEPVPLNALDVNNSGFSAYSWSPAIGLNNPGVKDPLAITDRNMTYTVVASTPAGCEGRDTIKITAFALADIFVPNAFTPNGDNRNDVFKAVPIGIREFKYFAVFNRYGQRVFYSTDPGKGWDGTINNNNPEIGAYVWQAAGISVKGDLIKRSGTVTLIR